MASIFLARRNLQTHRWRTFLTLLGIVLGVAVVLAVQITNQTTLDSLRAVFERTTGQASLLITPINENKAPLDEAILGNAERIEGVEVASPALRVFTLLASDAGSWQIAFDMSGIAAGNFFQLEGIDPELDPQVRVYLLKAGRLPKAEKYEVVIPAQFGEEKNLEIGDELVLLAPERPARLKIVGLLADEGVGMLNDGAVGFTSVNVVQELFQRGGEYDEIALRLLPSITENPAILESYKIELAKRFEDQGLIIYPAARGRLVSQMLATYQMGLTFFSIIAIFVGAFLIYNVFSMTVVERRREIGMLRAVGMERRQVLGMILAEAGLLSLVGSLIGLGVGYWLARGLIQLLGNVASSDQGMVSVPLDGLLQSIAVGIGVSLFAALIPGLQAARISPLEALRARSCGSSRLRPLAWLGGLVLLAAGYFATYQIEWPDSLIYYGGNIALVCFFLGATLTVPLVVPFLERLTRPLARLIYKNEGALGSANVRRAVGRTTLTVASLMVSLTMVISIESMAYAYEIDLQDWIDNALGGDIYVRAPLPMRESFANQLESVPGVETVTPARYLDVKIAPGALTSDDLANDRFYYIALDPDSFRQIGDMEFTANQGDPQGNWARLSQGGAVFISSVLADRYGLQQGDEILLLTRRGEQPFKVAAEVMDFGGQELTIYGTYSDLHLWFNEQGVDRFTLKLAPGYSVEAVSQEIEARYQDSQPISLQTTADFRKSILDLVDQSFSLFDVLSVIGVFIGALSVINTLTMNVLERQREIGGLRSLGMTTGQVLRQVLAEALALGVMGGVYGTAIGTVIAKLMIIGTNSMTGYDLSYQFTPYPYLAGVLIALGVAQLAAILPARRAARLNIIEAIKNE